MLRNRKKSWIIPLLAAAIVGLCTIAAAWLNNRGASTTPSSSLVDVSLAPSQNELPPDINNLFLRDDPIPNGYRLFRPGVRLSLVRSIYPVPPAELINNLGKTCYELPIEVGPFNCVQYYYCETETDPIVHRIVFFFRNSDIATEVRKIALQTFGVDSATFTTSDSLIWPNVGKLKLTIRQYQTYEIDKAAI